jgi:hypothetical protein
MPALPGDDRWKWIGTFLGATIHYDHVFEPFAPGVTLIRFTVDSTGALIQRLGGSLAGSTAVISSAPLPGLPPKSKDYQARTPTTDSP